jgi:hypothetical protein
MRRHVALLAPIKVTKLDNSVIRLSPARAQPRRSKLASPVRAAAENGPTAFVGSLDDLMTARPLTRKSVYQKPPCIPPKAVVAAALAIYDYVERAISRASVWFALRQTSRMT